MKGKHQIIVQNRRVQFKFSIERNITILRGDSATGKTKMIEMIAAYQKDGNKSGVNILENIKDSIVFIDEGEEFILSNDFVKAVQNSDNYYVIATRTSLFHLTYSTKEVYGIKNVSGNRYRGTKRIYSEFYPLCDENVNFIPRPDAVLVEDSNSGFEFFNEICKNYECYA